MTGIGIGKENSAYLRGALQPAYYMGFLHAAFLLELRKPEPNTRFLEWLLEERQSFIEGQQSEDRDAGLLLEPVFWTDHDPDYQVDEAEVLAMTPTLMPFLLCSSVEPHARWAVIFHEDDKTPTFFRTGEDAREACSAAMEEGRREREEVIEEAVAAAKRGEPEKVASILADWDVPYTLDRITATLTIESRVIHYPLEAAEQPSPQVSDDATRPDDGA